MRRLNWRPLETLCAAIALSHLILYGGGMAVYMLGLPVSALYILTAGAAVATLLCAPDLRRLYSRRHIRQVTAVTLGLFGYVLLMQLIAVHYAGAGWYGDWYEHYERARFFLDRPATTARFLDGRYILPARPPLMNILATHYMAHAGAGFEQFQVVFTFLNTLVTASAALVLPLLHRNARRPVWLLGALCALSPFIVQNSIWTWTKLYTAFLVVLGLGLYLRGLRRPDSARLVGAFVAFAAAALSHYSTGPFLLFAAGHYLIAAFPRRSRRWRELGAIVAAGTLVLVTWFGWSVHTYGAAATFSENTTVSGYVGKTAATKLAHAVYNVRATVVPYFMRGAPVIVAVGRMNPWAELRDAAFLLYQPNLLFALGSAGWLVALFLLSRALLMQRAGSLRERRFWLGLILFAVPVGAATHGDPDVYGLAQVIAQPLVVLGIALIAAGLGTLPRWLRRSFVAGVTIDFALGIMLHVHLLAIPFAVITTPAGEPAADIPSAGVGVWAANNVSLKLRAGITFLGDHVTAWQPVLQALVALCGIAALVHVVHVSRLRR